jgi:hypothetical protein
MGSFGVPPGGGVGHDGRMATGWVLNEDEALELLAYLISAARTQVDEAAEYGPMRLLTAAHRLAEAIAPRTSPATTELLEGRLARIPQLAVPRGGHEGYSEELDELCRSLAAHLLDRYGPGAR